jgi:hypothetical protein
MPSSGKIGIILINHSKIPYQINNGDRICQLCFSPVSINEVFFIPSLTEGKVREGEEINIVPKKQHRGAVPSRLCFHAYAPPHSDVPF